ncbi:MAG: hypothetical protein E6R03_11755 [Hyphomicrobiaceae bacterium]|nr:MAG: hypothetical protein E6R03_11755 [Hyphomicrobiaceae bacterium]
MKKECKTVQVEITGQRPGLLFNGFTVAVQAQLEKGSSSAIRSSGNKTPREQAAARLYMTEEEIPRPYVPSANLFANLVAAGSHVKVGRSKLTTMKSSLVPAALEISEMALPILVPGSATELPAPYEIDSRGVVIPATGGRVMCHRPIFHQWQLRLTLVYDAAMFDESVVRDLFDIGGSKIGLGDFRPSRKGPFGKFLITSWKPVVEGPL